MTYPRGDTLNDVLVPKFKCAGEFCPGLPYRASEIAHPASCAHRVANHIKYQSRPDWDRWLARPDTIINGKRNAE